MLFQGIINGQVKIMNEFIVTINKKKHSVQINGAQVIINGKNYQTEFYQINNFSYLLKLDNRPVEVAVNKLENGKYGLLLEGWYFDSIVRTKVQENANELMASKVSTSHKVEVRAPMPGLILKVKKSMGEKINPGDSLLILEAMKMENELKANLPGIVKEIRVNEGQSVEKGEIIMILE
jgi:biotin carboxyl carrier protein